MSLALKIKKNDNKTTFSTRDQTNRVTWISFRLIASEKGESQESYEIIRDSWANIKYKQSHKNPYWICSNYMNAINLSRDLLGNISEIKDDNCNNNNINMLNMIPKNICVKVEGVDLSNVDGLIVDGKIFRIVSFLPGDFFHTIIAEQIDNVPQIDNIPQLYAELQNMTLNNRELNLQKEHMERESQKEESLKKEFLQNIGLIEENLQNIDLKKTSLQEIQEINIMIIDTLIAIKKKIADIDNVLINPPEIFKDARGCTLIHCLSMQKNYNKMKICINIKQVGINSIALLQENGSLIKKALDGAIIELPKAIGVVRLSCETINVANRDSNQQFEILFTVLE